MADGWEREERGLSLSLQRQIRHGVGEWCPRTHPPTATLHQNHKGRQPGPFQRTTKPIVAHNEAAHGTLDGLLRWLCGRAGPEAPPNVSMSAGLGVARLGSSA